jgi:signal transduction histidine kinase
LSLAVRLPLFLLLAMAIVVLLFGAAAYRSVRDAAVELAGNRMLTSARELAANSTRQSAPRLAELQDLANLSAIRNSARETPTPAMTTTLDSLLTARRRPNDTTVVAWALFTDAALRYRSNQLGGKDSAMLSRTAQLSMNSGSIRRSPFFSVDSQVRVWTTIPVRSEDSVVAVLGELRRLVASPQAEEAFRRLTGTDVQVFVTSVDSDEWATVVGRPVSAPFKSLPPDETVELTTDSAGTRMYVTQTSVPETPWKIVLAQQENAILAGPNAFLGQLGAVGMLLLVVGTASAWLLGRREVRPLRQLQDAAEAMARGDYRQFVAPGGGSEMAALGDSFNTMAARIADAHAVLEHQNVALQRANDAKARFLAVMSHELRTPLNAIGGFTDLILLGVHGPTTKEQVDDLERIKRNKEQLLRIVTDILHYTRLQAEQHSAEGYSVALGEQLGLIASEFQEQFKRKQIALDISPSDLHVRADADCLRKIMEHLLSNALKFTPSGGQVRVDTQLSGAVHEDPYVQVIVSDSGIGMSSEAQRTIFDAFVQIDDSLTRREGGTGLGLAMVKELAVAMGGTIEVVSAPGQGSTFTLSLPAAETRTTHPAHSATSHHAVM